ncbi:uncharacterized protein LOC123374939 [Mauremys mutica]|uniref:uncharacterized protein LOC123374939 n=1 Tax=Mauremys mutica TaxID=74926 RepID=UPI001D1673CF|nr:uncharacterized protein LOC123374939 [Mauremys mutica]
MKGQPESSGGNPNCGLPNTGRLQQQLFLSRMKDPQFAAEEHNVNYEDAFLEKETANDMSHPSPLPNASKMLPFLKTHTKHVLLQDLPPSRKARSGYGINILKHCTRLQKYGVVKIRRKYKTTDIYFDGEIKKCEKILATYKGRLAFLLTTQDLTGPIYTTEMDFKHGGPNLEVAPLLGSKPMTPKELVLCDRKWDLAVLNKPSNYHLIGCLVHFQPCCFLSLPRSC